MPPKSPPPERPELSRTSLAGLVDPKHPPVRLAALIEWGRPAEAFGPPCREGVGRPGSPTRPMAGPHLLKHLDGLSDEAVCARYPDSPHVRLFCGETHFRHAPPPERTPMTRWRERIGAERLELPPAETPAAAGRAGAVEEKHPRRATIDATVQPEAVAHPTGGKLLLRGVGILNRSARRNGVALRQSRTRLSRRARREAARPIHRGRHREAGRAVRRVRTRLGRLARDIARRTADAAEAVRAAFAAPSATAGRLPRQRRGDRGRDKPRSPHAPEAERIGKGKARARHESGVEASLAATGRVAPGGRFVLGARAPPGSPHDGHTPAARIDRTERITGVGIERAHVDRGHRGHDADKDRVFASGRRRGVTPTMRRRSAGEAPSSR